MTDHVLIYLHGFLSSPQSVKARQVADFMAKNAVNITLEVPQLANFPQAALAQAKQIAKRHQGKALTFIGSSMGGFLATHLVNEFGGRAVLINPAVDPHKLLANFLGEHQNPYTGERFTLTQTHVEDLQALAIQQLREPQNLWVLLQQGDETLDYRLAEALYRDCHLTIEPGGNHAFEGFERYLMSILAFLQGQPKPGQRDLISVQDTTIARPAVT